MCVNVEELNKNVVTIKNYKSIKKKADEKLKPLEQTVKDFMDETGQTKYIGYGYSISYMERMKEKEHKRMERKRKTGRNLLYRAACGLGLA